MVEFNRLVILPNEQGLYLRVSIMDTYYFENVFLDKICIDTQDTYTPAGISSTPVYTHTFGSGVKSAVLTIKANEILSSLTGDMLFVYVKTKGIPDKDTPCGLDKNPVVKVVVNMEPIYRIAMKYLSDCVDLCEPSRDFINFILEQRAFESCLVAEDFSQAILFWNRFWKNIHKTPLNCKCNE